ncbi:G-type lectin S-receptor-like serine/threonine-protein kinase LECRK3 [Rosa rugosa]|uniref:G-type lectin S-receptor-like serine/threonine-protein kinase LECRK3 n=1 Tax=Rosa rugosa TaxID=74645 RepID=UPI002B40E124|nr:G-type lectin S-receptor-like serine/threonine-protein kinase LECRK3 [Rosa rugosa]
MPENICWQLTEETGGGACGFNSICRQDEKGPTTCECPKNYIFIDPNDERKGCKQNFLPQSCDEASPETDLFGFQVMLNTDWPNGDYEHFQPVTEEWCKKICLSDCFCALAIYDGSRSDCWKKGIPLSNGRVDLGVGWTSLVKIRLHNSTWRLPAIPDAKMRHTSNLVHIGSVLVLLITYLVVAMITYLVVSRIYSRKAKVIDLYPVNLKCFTYVELKQATNGFKEELGRGAFATVFKGVLACDKGKVVAVKRLDTVVRENDWEFKAEVGAIGGTNHRNLVKLQGFCNEGQHRILVYEFMSNGSLASFLFGEVRPTWYQRRLIALGTARGLLYLHEECSSQIIHCDIKPQNILLDDSYTARIADFGVAKLLKTDQTRTTTRIRGTKGYVAPEWYKSLPVTVKADVYSYGVLLLEIIFCRKNFEAEAEDDDQMILADWAYNCYKQQKLHLLLQNDDDEAKDDIKAVEKSVMIAFWCIQEDPSMRPTMKTVTQMLEGVVEVSVPQNPSSLYAI